MKKKTDLNETVKRMQQLYEYSFYNGTMEADDPAATEPQPDMAAGPAAADPAMAQGAMPPAQGGMATDPAMAQGAMAQPGMAAAPMAGGAMPPAAPMPTEQPAAGPQVDDAYGDNIKDATGEENGDDYGESLAPDAGTDMPADDGMGGMDDMGGAPGQDDDVVDVTQLTDAQDQMSQTQDEMASQMEDVNSKLEVLMKVVDKFTQALDANDEKLKDLQKEIVKRNPTDEENMNVRVHAGGNPFDQKPEEFWRKFKDINNHYNITANNEPPQYQIRKGDIDNYNEHLVADEFDDEIPGSLKEYFVR